MFGTDLVFDSPWWLLLLLLLPVLWVFSFKSLSGLGRVRRLMALAFRTIVFLLIVLALAEAQWRRTSEKMTVIYLLDQSESIPAEQRRAMLDYVIKEVSAHRDVDREDRAGLIVFGRDAAIEVPPFEDDIQLAGKLETVLDLRKDATNLAAAMKLAQATFPEDSAKRIVIVTDGNENIGDARAVGGLMTRDGIGIDIVPVEIGDRAEVAVEKVTLPEDVRKGQPLVATMVLNNMTQPTTDNPKGEVKGTLRLIRSAGGEEQTLEESDVTLAPGKNVFQSRVHEIERSQFYTYMARFDAADPTQDTMQENNRASAFTHVRGKGHVLLIEDTNNPGEFKNLVDLLQRKNIEVTVRQSSTAFASLADLQAYDSVIMANVARSSPDEVDGTTRINKFFSDDQIDMLVQNTQQMGAGIVMIGGDRSFGAGDWADTELEKAMPVDFTIRNAKIRGVGALVLLMHACELPEGNHWEKVVARQAVKGLGAMDFCGLLGWDNFKGRDDWMWKDNGGNGLIRVGNAQQMMINKIGGMSPGDMPDFDSSMQKALAGFNRCTQATTKHMIIISDGDPSAPSRTVMNGFINAPRGGNAKGIQISTVAIGTHGPPGSTPLQSIATQTGGKYYVVNNANALPRIYQREVRRVARPLIYEKALAPQVVYRHEMLSGIDVDALPTITGFVLTEKKENPLVEVTALTDQPAGEKNGTILASWNYGLGRTVVFTTDAGTRWAKDLSNWEYHDQFFQQMVEWSMRPSVEEGKFNIATDVKDGKVNIIVTALDKDDEFLNFIEMGGHVVGPDNKAFDVPIRQVAPGRYVGEFKADDSGSFLVNVSGTVPQEDGEGANAKTKMVPFQLRSGVSVPYSEEYRNKETNDALLEMLANLKPAGGERGQLIEGPIERGQLQPLLDIDTFRRTLQKAVSSNDIWPPLIFFMACVFLGDVFIRRVQLSYEWLRPVVAWVRTNVLRRSAAVAQPDERLERLKSRKQQTTATHEERRASARFEPTSDAEVDTRVLDAGATAAPPVQRPASPSQQMTPTGPEAETYTERLMKAKKQAMKGKKPPEPT